METHRSKVLKWILTIAIVIVLNLFFTFAIRLGYKEPLREAFCPVNQVNEQITSKDKCVSAGGQWNEYGTMVSPDGYSQPVKVAPAGTVVLTGSCWLEYTCLKNFDAVLSVYNRNVFVILIILGVISLGVGYAVGASSAVSLGLSLGGILALIIASMRYWSDMDDIVRVIVLAIALVALLWFGIKKFKD
ncbi:MAG: hypothetical protein WC764_01690 [Candidatus Paceibacterota bacterium]|jgi:hypothetical protein